MRVVVRRLVCVVGLAAGLVSTAPVSRADLVEDPASKAAFWSPEGWSASTQTRGAWKLYLRRAPDEKAMCGMAVAKATGTLDWALEAVEALWKQGPERYERIAKSETVVAGAVGMRVEHRISIPGEGRTLRALTLVAGAGEWRVLLWVAHEAGLEASYGPIVRRIHDSIVLPAATAPRTPVPPAPPPTSVPASGTAQGVGLLFEPRFREGRPLDVLVATGETPLLRGSVDAFVDLVEAVTDTTLPEPEEQALRDGVEAGWAKAASEDRALVESALPARDRAKEAAKRGDAMSMRAAIEGFRDALTARVAVKPAGAWQSVVRRAAARGLEAFTSGGEPAVTMAGVDSLEELLSFVTSLARNDGARVTPGQRAAVREGKVRAAVEAPGTATRRRVGSMRRFFAFVKARWDGADADTRLRVRWVAVDLGRGVAKLPDVTGAAKGEGLPAYARAAGEVAFALPVFETYTNVFENLDRVVVGLVEAFGLTKNDVDACFASEPLAER